MSAGIFLPGCRVEEGTRSNVRIIKKINNNAALGLDGSGTEVVVLGKGIGFPDMPYELNDYSKIQRTFYDMDPRYVQMAAGIPDAVLEASADIAEQAEMELECELNPNLPFTLADHLNFALERLRSGTVLNMPLSYDVRHLYPKEAALGQRALDMRFSGPADPAQLHRPGRSHEQLLLRLHRRSHRFCGGLRCLLHPV